VLLIFPPSLNRALQVKDVQQFLQEIDCKRVPGDETLFLDILIRLNRHLAYIQSRKARFKTYKVAIT
jgi:hypothetical protein